MAAQEFSAAAVIDAYRRAVAADQARILSYMQRGAEQHLAAVQRAYPQGPTGNLRGRVRLDHRNEFSWRVIATAPHVGLWERGTRQRQARGGSARGRGSRSSGKLANRGAARAGGPVFIPLAVRAREAAFSAVRALLARTVEV